MTVPHGLRSSWEREERRRELVEQAVAATDLDAYRAILEAVEPEDWYGVQRALGFRVGVAIVPEYVEHRQAKWRMLAEEVERRRWRLAARGRDAVAKERAGPALPAPP